MKIYEICQFLRLILVEISSWLCWGLTSQSTIFQLCWDGAIASWVFNQYFRGVKCLAQGHNTAEVGLEPRTSRSGVRHSTTEPPRSPEIRSENETSAGYFEEDILYYIYIKKSNVFKKKIKTKLYMYYYCGEKWQPL